MTEGINEPFTATNFTDEVANAVCIGSDTPDPGAFPATWSVDRLFFRSDRQRMYVNSSAAAGTINNPVWRGVDTEIGQIAQHAGPASTIGPGWLHCNGDAVPRATYPELFQVIGILYGPGNGNTTFHLPDFQTGNKFPRAATNDAQLGTAGGSNTLIATLPPTLIEWRRTSPNILSNSGAQINETGSRTVISAFSPNALPETTTTNLVGKNPNFHQEQNYRALMKLSTEQATATGSTLPPYLPVHYKIAV